MSNPRFPDGKPPWIDSNDQAARHLQGEEWLVIRPMLFSQRLAVMTADNASVEHWCFHDVVDAYSAWTRYPDVPQNWTRHFKRDHTQEYLEP